MNVQYKEPVNSNIHDYTADILRAIDKTESQESGMEPEDSEQ